MIPFVKRYILDNWQNLKLGQKPDDLLFIKFEDRRIKSPEVTIISFQVSGLKRNREYPLFMLRFPRYANNRDANVTLEREYKNLSIIHKKLNKAELIKVIPNPLLWEEINGSRVLLINFLSGKALSENMLDGNILKKYIENFGLAFSWSVEFQKNLGCNASALVEEIVEKVISNYSHAFTNNLPIHENYFSKLRKIAKEFKGTALPLYAQHGDFHVENILILDKKVSGVVDWEDFELQGIPCFDTFHFIRTYFEALFEFFAEVRDLSSLEKFSSSLKVIKEIKATLENYFHTLEINPELSLIFLPLYLIQSAIVAGSSRKEASAALKKLEILLRISPITLDDLLLFMSVFAYGDLYKKAVAEENQGLVYLCQEKIQGIQEISNKRAQKSGIRQMI